MMAPRKGIRRRRRGRKRSNKRLEELTERTRAEARLAAGLVICGVLGLAVAIAIDLPQGLDTGREGLAFYGAEAQLLGGFWVEVTASATLVLCGCLLPLYSRGVARPRSGRRNARSRTAHRDVGGFPPGLQAES
jgi:hypothetical protein